MRKTIKVLVIISAIIFTLANVCYADVAPPKNTIIGQFIDDYMPTITSVGTLIIVLLVVYGIIKANEDGEISRDNEGDSNNGGGSSGGGAGE